METEILAKELRPFWGRVAVLPSPVDEEERPSGLVLPLKHEDDAGILRGVVVALDEVYDQTRNFERISAGTVVYYRGGVRIRDVVILDAAEILAYEP